ncbi:MAG: hypothetical protein A2Y03_01720 [Omnitrophica WOR_2 bacterium GWF2_38_59]|nr:MAG: hypothetical protein A2Y03_01720 [Omnitrophica WOR_2 bacterium GWF2_38_59]OGX54755.1 MAG: hypothetical protein A2267_06045 [Omnitrophica WOR_2 bacterium RIFOXYA12_FULL_38_10]OGX55085.1 MAG: hypothetical protein A2447_02820 [Omnitrophica WOR_2 bacterium RIFOXYC2_FULL_38_12]OGX58073.1 MAG: hypothetical protein A2306_05095 [Omnitrophica WOR_2 bacterium RIFOXYB2_FULL_38_16]HBG61743.1 hypothetical protein [Candidatus Omnitrophota bacterium]
MDKLLKSCSLSKDYLSTCLRNQMIKLSSILRHVENAEKYDSDYISESLINIEQNLCNIRRFIQN